jgi:hypothetical protein
VSSPHGPYTIRERERECVCVRARAHGVCGRKGYVSECHLELPLVEGE